MNKRLDYYWPRAAIQITGIVFITQSVMEFSGVATRRPGFEWAYPACGIAFAIACIYTMAILCINTKRDYDEHH